MSRMIERRVQDIALVHLEQRYHSKARGGRMYSRIEVRTRKKYGGKRADGLLAFKRWLLGTYVVSMEAKSFKTLPAMKPYRDDRIWLTNSLWAGLLILLGTGAFLFLFRKSDGFWQFLIPLNVFLLATAAYAYFTRNSYRHKVVDVIDQVHQYPANEKWLAFSADSFYDILSQKQEDVKTICKYQGIGIIIVHSERRVDILSEPKTRLKLRKDYLIYYSKEDDIRAAIAKPS